MAEPEWAAPVSKKGLKEAIRDVLGGGSDITAANPLPVTGGTGVVFTVDITDDPTRFLGIIYGNQGQLQQRATGEILIQLNQAGAEAAFLNPIPVYDTKIIPSSKANLFRFGVVGGADFLPAEINTTLAYPAFWRIYASFDAAGVLSLRRRIGAFTRRDDFNAGAALVANSAYMFDTVVMAGEQIQFRYSVNAWANTFKVVELREGIV